MSDEVQRQIEEGRSLAFHLYEEAQRALQSWAIVEAYWRSHDPFASEFQRKPLASIGFAYDHMASAALRDALMTLSRMTDPPHTQKQSIFVVSQKLTDDVVTRLSSDHGGREFDQSKAYLVSETCRWDSSVKATDWEAAEAIAARPFTLMNSRAELDRFRNKMLAHARDRQGLGGLHLRRFRKMTIICSKATRAAMRVFRGTPWDPKAEFRINFHEQIELRRRLYGCRNIFGCIYGQPS